MNEDMQEMKSIKFKNWMLEGFTFGESILKEGSEDGPGK
jgi:hypothetical protein